MGVEKNIDAYTIESNSNLYFDNEKGQWAWTTEPIARISRLCCIDNVSSWVSEAPRYKRLYCEYCGCISGKEHGTCEHCGAPLKEMDE